ncbi:MAG: cytochrome c biogenesis protein CcsA [Actinomycetota bacterium]|nr:cytochrome c biogenesis protein CcsA [Actinomycetota bacterium]
MERISVFLFWLALAIYALAFAMYANFFASRRHIAGSLATGMTINGWVVHTASLIFRGLASGHLPGATAYESLSAVAWLVIMAYLFVEYFSKSKVLGIFITAINCVFLVKAWGHYQPPGPRLSILRSSLVDVHFMLIFIASAAFTVAAGCGLLYLLQEWQMKGRRPNILFRRLPSLEVLDDVGYRAVLAGFLFFTLCVATGAIQARQVWGTIWDPIVVASAVSWSIYAFYLLLRAAAGWMGKRAAILAIIGFLCVMSIRFAIVPYVSYLHGFRG